MKTGLYFGSFNPVHIGHLAIANYMAEFTDLEQVWFVVSPHNPLKKKPSLLADRDRYDMVYMAAGDSDMLRVSDIEFSLSKPSYTINTLAYLQEKYPKRTFSLIMGADNLETLEKWKNYQELLDNYDMYVYPRPGSDGGKYKNHERVKMVNAPLMEISGSFLRDAIKKGHNIKYFLPEKVYEYIVDMHFYEK